MAPDDAVLLTGCTVVDCAVPGRRQPGSAVLVREGRIAAVAPAPALRAELAAVDARSEIAERGTVRGQAGDRPTDRVRTGEHAVAGVRVEDLDGAYVIPGLWDAHVHLGDVVPPHVAAYSGESQGAHMVRCVRKAQDNLRAGITSLRSLGERHDHDVVLRDLVEAGAIEGPRIFASGDVAWTATASGVEQFRAGTRRLARLGVDQIKVLGSGGIPTRSPAGITTPFVGRDELAAVCDEAARWALPVVLHAMGDETVTLGVQLGVRSIEHGFAMSEAMAPLLAGSETALCPNLVVTACWDPAWMAEGSRGRFPPWMVRNAAEARQRHHDVVRACIAAGVRLLAGADDLPEDGGPIGIERAGGRLGLVRELELLVELGASPGVALQAATLNPAWAVGRDGELGTIEPGKVADLVVLPGDPLEDLSVLERPLQVWKDGRLVVGAGGALQPAPG